SASACRRGTPYPCRHRKRPRSEISTTRACASSAPTRSKASTSTPRLLGNPPKGKMLTKLPAAFAACALGRTLTVSFACRAQHRAMNNCMKRHATPEEHDAAREEWFAMRVERHRQRERKAKMAAAQEDFIREWWGLPEEVRLSKQRDLEKLGRAERVGGMAARDRRLGPGESS
ncbi:hypothetical protein E4U53_004447, partial [Claviceps sorghi]